jgi:hypothetical protein
VSCRLPSISVNYTNTLWGAVGAIVSGDGILLNSEYSGFSGGGTLSAGSVSNTYAYQNVIEEVSVVYPFTDSFPELKVNRIFCNEIYTRRIVMPPPCGCWVVNAGDGDLKINNMFPVVYSLKNAGKFDDQWILGPGYKLELFFLANYEIRANFQPWAGTNDYDNQVRVVDNTEGRTVVSRTSYQIYGINNGVNVFDKVGSLKLYYNGTEIRLSTFSF